MHERVSQKQLEELKTILSARDKELLLSIRRCRYITTGQISRLHFTESPTSTAAQRAASRSLNKLKELGLISSLKRRIGGVRAGSAAAIWYICAAAETLLRIMGETAHPVRKHFEPSTYFLAHTLAVSECYLMFNEICSIKNMRLAEIHTEPDCWRPYNSGGKIVTLKPDLFAVTVSGAYEDRWFIEMDLATESSGTVLEKCRRYHQYYQSGMEQKQYRVFPLIVWIVPDSARKESMCRHIHEEFSKLPNIFVVITPDEVEHLIREGAVAKKGGKL